MGRRRRKIVRFPKKKLPTIFLCPSCGERSINVQIEKDYNIADVRCSKCGIKSNITITLADQPIDIYCKFTDSFYEGTLV
jgi:transcription elongation factor Elf1